MVIGRDIIQKTRDDYNKIAHHFAKTRRYAWPEFNEFSGLFKPGQRVLDWGCGGGRLLMFLENKQIEYFGIDQSIEVIKIARRLYAVQVEAGAAHFYCNANRLKQFPKNYFDVACLIASFFHLPDVASRHALLKKIYQELKPGGKIIILVWNLGSDWAQAQFKKGWQKIGENDFLIPWKNPAGEIEARRYYHHFSPEELNGLLTKAGFMVERLGYSAGTRSDEKGGRNLIVIAVKK